MKLVAFTIVVIAALTVAIFAAPGVEPASSPVEPASSPTVTEVKIDNFSFNPPTLKVKAGTTVQWTNRDDLPHNVVAEEKAFRSKAMDTDEQFSFTFDKPGTYAYFCGLHPKMKGTITVE
ncbi:MAG TPA: cupredoxin family copper-binding protein [Candidatus Angelobacter sp.]|jgi:amicyanin|nr:cupredoxin family copper-binding protein [Candidatus Angelobacter sp.]